mmetsp:Transcript_37002/g.87929  ORF Transcript_37002/g.87929 Transcript_37002/m.87929 type:complete len:311 (+) Transcript_37002:637-1569(+)
MHEALERRGGEGRVGARELEVGGVVVAELRHVPPVSREVVRKHAVPGPQSVRDDVPAEVDVLSPAREGVSVQQEVLQDLAAENVDAHGGLKGLLRRGVGARMRHLLQSLLPRLLDKRGHAARHAADADDAEAARALAADRDGRDRHVRPALPVEGHKLPEVHLVERLPREHEQVLRWRGPRHRVEDRPEVPPDGVRRARGPGAALGRLRGREHLDPTPARLPAKRRRSVGGRDVVVERGVHVLREHIHLRDARCHAVADWHIDHPVGASEGDGGDSPEERQRVVACTSRQDQGVHRTAHLLEGGERVLLG